MKMPQHLPSRPSRSENRIVYVPQPHPEGLAPQGGNALCCGLACAGKAGTVACDARCLLDGQACDGGINNCTPAC